MQVDLNFPIELQRRFEQAIIDGEFAAGHLLSTMILVERFHASPHDMDCVLASAYRKGLIAPAGVSELRVLGLISPRVESVFQHTAHVGLKSSSHMRGVIIEPATAEIAERLDVPVGSPVYRLDRTRLVNDEVLANQTNIIPFEVCPGLENDDVSHASFQQLIDIKYHAVTAELKEEFAIVRATNQDSEILDLAPDTQILSIRRLALSVTARPLIWTDIHVRPDRFEYVAALWPSAQILLEQFHLQNHR